MKKLKLAVIGLGNVGRALVSHCLRMAERLEKEHNIQLQFCAVCDSSDLIIDPDGLDAEGIVSHKTKTKRLTGCGNARPLKEDELIKAFKNVGVNIIIEALPTNLKDGQPSLSLIEEALNSRMHVVTANKGPLLYGLCRLEKLAAQNRVKFAYSGATGAALPTLSFARRELAGARIDEIAGVLNGTTNYILTRMSEEGKDYWQALSEAKLAGIAEPDPSFDVKGWDTACKLVIIANALMHCQASLKDVICEGIDGMPELLIREARKSSRAIRLIGRVVRSEDRVHLSVAPEVVGPDSPFFNVRGASKAITFRTDTFGMISLIGGASGRTPVAATLLKDIIHIAEEGKR